MACMLAARVFAPLYNGEGLCVGVVREQVSLMTNFNGRNLVRNLRGLKKEEFEGLKLFDCLIVYMVYLVRGILPQRR